MRKPLFPFASPVLEIELIRLLYASKSAMVMLALILVAVIIEAGLHGDMTAVGLASAVLLITLTRIATVQAFRRRTAAAPLDLPAARHWEQLYAWGSYAAAAGIGVANYHALSLDDPVIAMLIVGITFGYVFSIVLRISVRPVICAISVLLVIAGTGAGSPRYLDDATSLSPPLAVAAFVLIGAVLVAMALEMMRYTYCLILDQLTARRDLSRMVRQDALTGLPNRISLRERFDAAASESPGRCEIAVHYLDLDHFKAVNDTHGHRTGDALLRQAANRMTMCIRAGDTVARLGGDEFVIIQSGIAGEEEAEELARRVIASVGEPYTIKGVKLRIGVTIGIAIAPRDGGELDRLLGCADAALYRAKESGRGAFARWTDALPATSQRIRA